MRWDSEWTRLSPPPPILQLRRWNGGSLDRLWWQQDGATIHVTDVNMRYLDAQFGPRVISRRPIRGIDWPARSPDLSPLDYCLWGYLKSKVTLCAHSKSCHSNNHYRDVIIICALQVYTPWPANLDALEGNLRREVAALDPAMIRRAILDMRVRANKCIDNNGGHFEK